MKFALHAPIPSNLPPRTSNLCFFIPLRTLSHSSPVTPLFATLTKNNRGGGLSLLRYFNTSLRVQHSSLTPHLLPVSHLTPLLPLCSALFSLLACAGIPATPFLSFASALLQKQQGVRGGTLLPNTLPRDPHFPASLLPFSQGYTIPPVTAFAPREVVPQDASAPAFTLFVQKGPAQAFSRRFSWQRQSPR
jgi:hypothetical protein